MTTKVNNNDESIVYAPNNIDTIFLDMDGVIAIYDRGAYPEMSKDTREYDEKQPALFEQQGAHYFATCDPDEKILNVLRRLLLDKDMSHIKHIGIITTVSKPMLVYMEQRDDKLHWLKEQLSVTNDQTDARCVFLPSIGAKADTASAFLGRTLTKRDILIDDYNDNLNSWESSGGRAIKYGNSINNEESFNGLRIPKESVEIQIYEFLQKL